MQTGATAGRVHDPRDAEAIDWLLASGEPAIRALARRELLDEEPSATDAIRRGALVRGLLAGQRADGGFGGHPYAKWDGSFWRVISLVELGVPAGEPAAVAAARNATAWVTGPTRRARLVDGLVRQHAAAEGFMLAVHSRLGLAATPVAAELAERLLTSQWPDGGWNCDPRRGARRSSFHESFAPAWGLWEYAEAIGDTDAKAAADRTTELVLDHRVAWSRRGGEPVHPSWVQLHWPSYWHYDVLAGLRLLARTGRIRDERAAAALDLLESRRRPDGRWRAGGSWWKSPGKSGSNVEVVDWGRRGPSEMITLAALGLLQATGRLSTTPPARG